MTDFQKMEQLAEADGGVLKTSSVTAMGISSAETSFGHRVNVSFA